MSETRRGLIEELSPLTHAGRMRHMAFYGRLAAEPGAAGAARRAALDELEGGGFFERLMALQSCHGSRDGARVLRALADPSRVIRSLAASLAPLFCDDVQFAEAVGQVPRSLVAPMLRGARRHRRGDLVDRALSALEAAGDRDFLLLMPYGSERFVRARLDALAAEAGPETWARLGRVHPGLAADHLAARAAATGYDPRLAAAAQAAFPLIARGMPDRAVALLAALAPHVAPVTLDLTYLAKQRPAAVADLLLAAPPAGTSYEQRRTLAAVAERLGRDAARLGALVARFGALGAEGGAARAWLRRLPVERRRAVYAVAGLGWRDEHGALAPDLVALLPRPEREAEARRNWALPAHQTWLRRRLAYAGLLPFDETLGLVEPYLRNPDADFRAGALDALVGAVRFERARLPDALALLRARGNEQDPVRQAMLGALARLPPSAFGPAAPPLLDTILRQALDATDLSYASVQALERLVMRLLPVQPAWAVRAFETLMRERGAVSTHGLEDQVGEADLRRLAPVLWPVLTAWHTREREHQIIAFARLLGRRSKAWNALADLLAALVEGSRTQAVSAQALALLARHRRDRFAALVPGLLRRDPTWITQAPVQEHLHRRRQDLLDPFLGQQAFTGRFGTGRTRYVLPFRSGFERWNPAQQHAFARTLESLTTDAERDSPALAAAIDQLAALPDVGPDRLRALAALDNPRVATREAALRALARRDGGDGLDVLLAALGDERARIAIYALRGALSDLPEARVLALLRAVPRTKITVFKEVVRLAGERAGEEAYRFLLEIEAEDRAGGLHRDVRVALIRALWDHLERDETWPILERAAASPDPAIAAMAGRTPAGRLSAGAEDRLAGLVAALLRHPEPRVRVDALTRIAGFPVNDRRDRLGAPILAALGSTLPDEIRAAAAALVSTRAGRGPDRLGEAVAAVLPKRRALTALADALATWLRFAREDTTAAARAVLDALAADPLTGALRTELAWRGLPAADLAPALAALAREDALHADALRRAVDLIETGETRHDPEALEAIEAGLAASEDPRLRRLALAVLVRLGRGSAGGWSEARLARLERRQADPSPLVAEAAQFTFVADGEA